MAPTSADRLALSMQGVGKAYRITTFEDRPFSLSTTLLQRARQPLRRAPKETFQALTDVTLEVAKGEAVGIIGRNGSGKSTMLKILSRVTQPSKGRVELFGRVSSLLEVGTGFHPELTGRENIFLNGAILGMRRQDVVGQFDSIVDFAGIDRFLATPVKRYSTGMYVRLAFAVAAHLRPDILVVDEVLAVGDLEFQKKCLGKMGDVTANEGRTVLFVSHNMAAVESFCRRGIVLEEGRVVFDGEVSKAVHHYLSSGQSGHESQAGVNDLSNASHRRSTTPMLRSITLRDDSGLATSSIGMGEGLSIAIELEGLRIPEQGVVVRVVSERDVGVINLATTFRPLEVHRAGVSPDKVMLSVPALPLAAGRYWIDLFVQEGGPLGTRKVIVDHVPRAVSFDVVSRDVYGSGYEVRTDGRWSGLIFVDHGWEMRSEGVVVATSGLEPPSRSSSSSARQTPHAP